jgi:hypothetical protein
MKKIFKYAAVILGVLTLVACSNGGGCPQCEKAESIIVTPITPPNPDNFVPSSDSQDSYIGAGATNPNYISKDYNQIAVPNASTGNTSYIVYNLPVALSESLKQSTAGKGESSISMLTLVSSTGNQIVLVSTPGASPTSPANVYIVLPQGQTPPNYLISGGESGPKDYVLVFPIDQASKASIESSPTGKAASSYNFIVPLPINTNIIPAFIGYQTTQGMLNSTATNVINVGDATAYELPVNISSCAGTSDDRTTSVAQTLYNGTYYIAAGTANGNVCIVNADGLISDPTSFVNNFSWTANLANGYTMRYTPRGEVLNMSFPPQSSQNILGFWNIKTSNVGNTIYRITGQYTGQGSTGFVPTSFWNVSINTKQYSPGTGSSITFSNSPADGFSMLTDSNLNTFVGTYNGKVYKLAYGSAIWSTITLTNSSGNAATGPVSLSPTTNPKGTGVIATTNITTESSNVLTAFTLQ